MLHEQDPNEGRNEVFAPGNIVRLREPYKPDDQEGPWRSRPREEWRAWPGWTHGIIAEIVSRSHGPAVRGSSAGDATRVSLHLYDPARGLLYIHDRYTVPAYCDFHVNELILHKVAVDEGYGTLPEI